MFSNKVIGVTGSVEVYCDICHDCQDPIRQFQVSFFFELPRDLTLAQIDDDNKVKGLVFTNDRYHFDYTCDQCGETNDNTFLVSFDKATPTLVDDPGVAFIVSTTHDGANDDDDDSEKQEDEEEQEPELREIFDYIHSNTTMKTDTHWDCYCKKRTVCGCGCDPKHDGW